MVYMMLCLTNDIRIWITTSWKTSTKVHTATLDSDFHAFVSYFGSSFVFPMDIVIVLKLVDSFFVIYLGDSEDLMNLGTFMISRPTLS